MTLKEILATLRALRHPFMLKGESFVVSSDQKNAEFVFDCISVCRRNGRIYLFFVPISVSLDLIASAIIWNPGENEDENEVGYWSLLLWDNNLLQGDECGLTNVDLFEVWKDRQFSQTIPL